MNNRSTILVFIAFISVLVGTTQASNSNLQSRQSPILIGAGGELTISQSQLNALAKVQRARPNSSLAKLLSNKYAGQSLDLDDLGEKDVLDLWQVLTPNQQDALAKKLDSGLLKHEPVVGILFLKNAASPFHIPPEETFPPEHLFSNGKKISLDQIKTSFARINETSACESASVAARAWIGVGKIEPALVSNYNKSLNEWVNACLTQDSSDTASLAGLDLSMIRQVIGVISYGDIRFCTGLLKDGEVITAKHCFMRSGVARLGKPPVWACPTLQGEEELWCVADKARGTLVFTRASDPSHQIPLSLARAGITAPSNFAFETDRISLSIRDDNSVPLTGLPKVEWDIPRVNDLVWLAGPIVSATQPDKYEGIYWSKFLSGKCRIVELDGKCIRHYCQAVGGFSGSPIFSKTISGGQGTVKVAGIHLGASESYKECKSDAVRLNIAQASIQ